MLLRVPLLPWFPHAAAISLAAVVALAACGASPRPAASAAESRAEAQQAVAAVLDDWHDAAARGDFDRYFAHYDPAGTFLGTDAGEVWDVPAFKDYARAPFADGVGWVLVPTRRSLRVAPSGQVAWFEENLESEGLGPCRGSGVLLRQDGRWRIAQYNLALTVPNARLAEVRALLAAAPPLGAGKRR